MGVAVRTAAAVLVVALAACTHGSGGSGPPAVDGGATATVAPATGADADTARAVVSDAGADGAGAVDADADAGADASVADGVAALHTYRRVLHIGDSMVGFKFGLTRALGTRFEADGAKFFSIPITSAGIQSFEKGTDLDEAIKKTHPDLVLITLGANNATSPAPEYLVPAIKRVVKKIGVGANPRRKCVWIGPPLWKPDKVGFIDVLAKSTEPCRFFDSSHLVIDRMSDGIHPTNKGGEVWAEAVYQYLIEQMAHDG